MTNSYRARQRLLSTPYGDDIFQLPTDTSQRWLIGDIAPSLGRYTRRLRSLGLIVKIGKTTRSETGGSAIVWSTTDRYVEYCKKYGGQIVIPRWPGAKLRREYPFTFQFCVFRIWKTNFNIAGTNEVRKYLNRKAISTFRKLGKNKYWENGTYETVCLSFEKGNVTIDNKSIYSLEK